MYPKDIIERIKLPFRKDKELYSSFYKILGFYPHHIQYYEQALHHKSSSIKKQGSWEITLVNGKKLPISEERQKYFNQQYSHLLGGEINV